MKTPLFCCLALVPAGLYAQIFVDKTANLPLSYTAPATMDVEAADVDGDGDIDLVLAMEFTENILLFNDGTGKFSVDLTKRFPKTISGNLTGQDSEDIAIADFDGDGDLDILFVSEDTPKHEFFLNDGTGKFILASYQFPGNQANAVGVTDINGDHLPDVIIGNKGQNTLYINQGDASFVDETAERFPINTDQTQDLKFADIDGDGDLDLIEGIELGGNNIYTFEDGKYTLANERLPDFNSQVETRKVVIGDVNGDGAVDLFYCNVGWTPGYNPQNRLLLNDGNGYFTDVSDENLPFNFATTLDALLVDIDADNDLDLITTDMDGAGSHYKAYRNDGTGKFIEATTDVFPGTHGNQGIGLKAADFNGDGKLDIYFANFNQTDKLFFSQLETTATQHAAIVTKPLQISPNPATDFIELELPVVSEAEVVLLDQYGKIVQQWRLDKPEQRIQQSVAALAVGSYTILLKTSTACFKGVFVKVS